MNDDLDLRVRHALALAKFWDEPPAIDVDEENRAHRLNVHRCCFCPDFLAEGDRIACAECRLRLEAELAQEPPCRDRADGRRDGEG